MSYIAECLQRLVPHVAPTKAKKMTQSPIGVFEKWTVSECASVSPPGDFLNSSKEVGVGTEVCVGFGGHTFLGRLLTKIAGEREGKLKS